MCDLKDLNDRYGRMLTKLKESKGTFVQRTKEVTDLKEKRDEMEKDLEDISRFR